MQLCKTTRNAILNPLQTVCGIIERKSTLPILQNALLTIADGKLTAMGSDLEIQITTSAEIETTANASLTVQAKKLSDILKALPETADVTMLYDDKRLTIKSGKSKFNLQTIPADDYPKIKPAEAVTMVNIKQGVFKRLLAMTQYAMAQHDVRYYLNGVLFELKDGNLTVVGTDGHRLAYARDAIEQSCDVTAILPRKIVLELTRQLSDGDEPLSIEVSSNQAIFKFSNVEIITKLIDGKFPDYNRVIPTGNLLVTMKSDELKSAMQRAAILSNEKFRGVRIILKSGMMEIIAVNSESEEAVEEIDIEYNGEPLDIGFNVGYLADVLLNVASDDIELRFADSSSSVLFTLPNNDAFKYVVMPMRM